MLLLTWKPACNSAFKEKSAVPLRWMVRRVEGAMLRTALPGAWASKQCQGAAKTNRSAGARRVEQLNDSIFEFLFPLRHTELNQCNFALPVDQQRGGQRVKPAVRGTDIIVAEKDTVVHLAILDVGLNNGPTIFVHGDAEHGKTLVLELPFEIDKPGDLDLAGAAPGGPEIQQYDLALVVGGMNGLTVGVFQAEPRGWLSDSILQVEPRSRLRNCLGFRRSFHGSFRASGPQERASEHPTN